MKKSVRFISIVMIIAMVFSMTCSAFAERGAALPEGATASNYTISGGTSSKGGGNTTVSANTRPSYYTNSRGDVVSSKELEVEGTAEAPKYLSDDDYYEALESADDVNIANNADFIMYIHDNLDDPTLIADGTIDTAYALFGTDVIEGTADLVADADEEQAEGEEAEQAEEIVENMPPQFLGEEDEPAAEAPAEEQPAAEEVAEEQSEVREEASVPAEEPAAPVEEPAAPVEEPAASAEESAVPGELASAKKVIHAEAISYPGSTSTKFHTIHGYGSLISYLGSSEKVYMAETFDICNSTDYRITIDMGGTNVYAPPGEYAFYICKSGVSGRSTITFTNGTITGNGFYVDDDGVLNLGGYYNTKFDILVIGESRALYVGNKGTAVIGQGAQLKCSGGDTVEIEAGGQVRMSGGLVEATDPDGFGYNAVYNCGVFLLNSTGENVNYSYGVVRNLDGIAIYGDDSSQTTIGAGTVEGQTGIALDTDSKLTMYNGTVTGKGVKNDTWTDGNCGAAIAVNGWNSGPVATISGGALRSEKAAAIMDFDSGSRIDQAKRDAITNITLFSDNIITEQKAGEVSDYRVSKFTVNGIGYVTLGEAITAAYTAGTATIVMGGDYTMDAADAVAIKGTNITFDGNGHRLDVPNGYDGLTVDTSANLVTIKNLEISGTDMSSDSGITVNGGTTVTIGPNVQIGVMLNGINTTDGEVLVNDVFLKDSCATGINASGGVTKVSMVTDDSKRPVYAPLGNPEYIVITGGWFKYDKSQNTGETTAEYFIKTYIDILQSHIKYVTDDKYYEVFYNDDPTVELISAEVVGTSDDVVYIAYDKSSATPIKFNFGAPVNQIDAISRNAGKTVYPIFSSPAGGTSGEVRIADQAVLMDLPAGIYDLKFTFANGAVITDKLVLYVYPRIVAAFKVPNTLEMSSLEADAVKKYISDDYRLSSYDVTDDYNIAVVMSEVDNLTKVSVGSNKAPFGDDVRDTNYIEYYLNGSPISADTFRLIPANSTDYGKYAGNYVFFISYADLNNLTPGQNYVFLDYADLADDQQIVTDKDLFAYNRFPFSVTNKSVSISPSSIQWTSLSGTAKFTVKPDVLDDYSVYIDGENVDKAYWTYDKDTNVLSIKGSYLGVLDKKEHTLEVLTSKGKVGASVNTKIGIMPKNLDYHVYGGAKALSFIASDKINKEGGVWIGSSNPTKLDPSCYTWDGENGFTLSAAFLNKLALGTYYVSAYVWNGEKYEYCTTSFKVISASQASYNPSTGDNSKIFIWLAVLALSAVAIVVILLPRFKKNKAVEGVADDAAGNAKHKK